MGQQLVLQKTVSRKIVMACGHQHRVRLDVPSRPPMSRRKFDEWAEGEFSARAAGPCPPCRAAGESQTLDQQEDDLLGPFGVRLTRFDDEPLAVATFARSVRYAYLRMVSERLHAEDGTWTDPALNVVAAWLCGPGDEPSEVRAKQVRAVTADLVFRHLSQRADDFQPRYWISKKAQMARLAERDTEDLDNLLPGVLVAVAGYADAQKAHAVYAGLRQGSGAEVFDLAHAGSAQGLGLGEVLERIAFLRALNGSRTDG